ncbi:MAG: hypothetical protein ACREIF_02215 [Chthoniobacterales bacterium]
MSIETNVANWGIELAFIRTRVGQEFEVIDSLSGVSNKATYFSTYGHFDVAAVRTIESLNTPYAVVLHRNVNESAPFRFFAHQNSSKSVFEETLTTAPAAIAVMAKIHPLLIGSQNGEARWRVAEAIREKLPKVFIFLGLGFSELLIIDTGADFAEFLATVRELRGLSGEPESESPALSKTTTFPFVSYEVVHRTRAYDLLKGSVEPVITISCQPASERAIAKVIRESGIIPKHIWGKNDLLLTWPNAITVANLIKFVCDFRGNPEVSQTLARTTTYWETPIHEQPIKEYVGSVTPYEFLETKEEQSLFTKLEQVRPHSLRASLSDLCLRLSACLRSPLLTEFYRDMVNTFEYVSNLLGHLVGHDPHKARHAGVQASRVADAARAAINQRYAGLELHPETLAHSPSPLLCDIRTVVAAATCVPHYIFDRLFEGKRAAEVWPGFVLFGGTYSPQWLDQDVLALPPSSLLTPIEEWWKITHEAAHAVFRLTNVDGELPRYWHDNLNASTKNEWSSLQMLAEQFANWFDWKYIFKADTRLYLRTIWRAWLQLPIVWQSKPQYFARSFGVTLAEDPEVIAATSKQNKYEGAIPLIRQRWNVFQELVRDLPNMREYLDEVQDLDVSRTFELTYALSPIAHWFETQYETRCGVTGLFRRMDPDYPELGAHAEQLLNGRVILRGINDPPRLHLALLKALDGNEPSLATHIAFLYSFENAYLGMRQS